MYYIAGTDPIKGAGGGEGWHSFGVPTCQLIWTL